MLFSTRGPLALAFAASLASATPLSAPAPVTERGLGLTTSAIVNIDLNKNWSGEALVEGVVVDASVQPVVAVGAEVDLAVICKTCYTRGAIDASVAVQGLIPALSLSLTDIEAYLDLEVKLGLATTIAVNLFTPVAPIELPIAGLKVSALVYLDLVLSVDAAIDFTGGIWIKLAESALLETNILSGAFLKNDFSGLSVKTLPIEVQVGCTTLRADLRLRVQLAAEADVDAGSLLGLASVIPDVGAGVELGIYANLVEYVGLLCDTPSCPVSKESYGLNIGAAVELDVEVEDILSLNLAPTVSIGLLTLPTVSICEHGPRPTASGSVSSTISKAVGASASVSTSTYAAPITVSGGVTGPSASVSTSTYAAPITVSGGVTGPSASVSTSTYAASITASGGVTGPSASGSHDASHTGSGGFPRPSMSVGTGTDAGSHTGSGGFPRPSMSVGTGTYAASGSVTGGVAGSSVPVGTGTHAASVPVITSSAGADGSDYGSGMVTSTVKATTIYTITSCAASVANCPASYASEQTVVKTVDVYTTVCPATASLTAPASVRTTFPASSNTKSAAVTTATTDATELVPCSSVNTFTAPTGVSTVPAKATSSPYSGSQATKNSPVSTSTAGAETYPTYAGKGYNGTAAYPETSTSVYSKTTASVYYHASATYPATATATPVTAGAGKAGSAGVAAVLAMAGAAVAMF